MSVDISVVILAKNEEKYLKSCLDQFVGFADEIIYGDMESTDRSVDIAKKYTKKIFHLNQTDNLDSSKSELCEHSTGSWILVVDADEVFPGPLLNKLKEIMQQDTYDVIDIPRQIYIQGIAIKGMGWQDDSVIRFFRRNHVIYSKFHHSKPQITGNLLKIPRSKELNIKHYWVEDWKTLVRKITYYTEGQAQKLNSLGVCYSNTKMLYSILKSFGGRYIKNYGFLNGWIGLKVSLFMTIDVFLTYMRLEELQKK